MRLTPEKEIVSVRKMAAKTHFRTETKENFSSFAMYKQEAQL
jgi:hypothetical protein